MKDELSGIVVSHKPVSEGSLRRLLLIFDRINFLDPEENLHLIPQHTASVKIGNMEFRDGDYGVLYNGINHMQYEDNLLDNFNYAVDKNIISVQNLKSRKFHERNWFPLKLAYSYDNANATLLNHYLPLIENNPDTLSGDGILIGGSMSYQGINTFPDTPPIVEFFARDDEDKKYSYNHQILSMCGRMNKSLAVAGELDLIPIFINEHYANAYSTKLEIAKNNQEPAVIDKFFKLNNLHLSKVQHLMYKISELFLPDEIINAIPPKQFMYARNNTFHECYKLRRKLLKSINFLATENFDDKFLFEADVYIKNEIEPLIADYQSKFKENITRFLNIVLPASFGLIGGLYGIQQNLNPLNTAYLGGVSAVLGSATSELANYITKRNDQKINTFSYFINLRD